MTGSTWPAARHLAVVSTSRALRPHIVRRPGNNPRGGNPFDDRSSPQIDEHQLTVVSCGLRHGDRTRLTVLRIVRRSGLSWPIALVQLIVGKHRSTRRPPCIVDSSFEVRLAEPVGTDRWSVPGCLLIPGVTSVLNASLNPAVHSPRLGSFARQPPDKTHVERVCALSLVVRHVGLYARQTAC